MFDLWPILQEQEQASKVVLAGNSFSRLLKQSFCPDCKQAVLLGMAEQEALDLEDTNDLDETQENPERSEEETEEYEMMLDLD